MHNPVARFTQETQLRAVGVPEPPRRGVTILTERELFMVSEPLLLTQLVGAFGQVRRILQNLKGLKLMR